MYKGLVVSLTSVYNVTITVVIITNIFVDEVFPLFLDAIFVFLKGLLGMEDFKTELKLKSEANLV